MIVCSATGCSTLPGGRTIPGGAVESPAVRETPFDYLSHLVVVPVVLDGVERSFVLDSGIGVTVVRDSISDCTLTGASFTGRRMSGQEVTLPLAVASSLEFAGITRPDFEVGLLDLSGFPRELAHIDGFLSLSFFSEHSFAVDYGRRTIRSGNGSAGVSVDVEVVRDGPSVTVFAPLSIPGGRSIEVEVDMGSDCLILDERFAAETGARLEGLGVRVVDGTDETGHLYTRRFTRLPGMISLGGRTELVQDDPEVMFQSIIHDGLIGHAFLRRFVVTWDLAAARLAFAPYAG